jgi:hypothetical protein
VSEQDKGFVGSKKAMLLQPTCEFLSTHPAIVLTHGSELPSCAPAYDGGPLQRYRSGDFR